jgi:hypothetical protein
MDDGGVVGLVVVDDGVGSFALGVGCLVLGVGSLGVGCLLVGERKKRERERRSNKQPPLCWPSNWKPKGWKASVNPPSDSQWKERSGKVDALALICCRINHQDKKGPEESGRPDCHAANKRKNSSSQG